MKKKQSYNAPCIEVIVVQNEGGIMIVSGDATLPDIDKRPLFSSGSSRTRSSVQAAGPLQEFEDVINDLLTVKK